MYRDSAPHVNDWLVNGDSDSDTDSVMAELAAKNNNYAIIDSNAVCVVQQDCSIQCWKVTWKQLVIKATLPNK